MSKFRTGYHAALTDVADMLRHAKAREVMPLSDAQLLVSAPIGRTTELALHHAAYLVEQMPSDHQVIEASHE